MNHYKHRLENLAGDLESRYGIEDEFVREVRAAITQLVIPSWGATKFGLAVRRAEPMSDQLARASRAETQAPQPVG